MIGGAYQSIWQRNGGFQLTVQDGLLAIDCVYSNDSDMTLSPTVWIIGNGVPWDPCVLDEGEGLVVTNCWDHGVSELNAMTKNTWDEPSGYSNYLKFMSCQQQMVQVCLRSLALLFW